VFTRGKSLPRRCPICDGTAIGKATWLRLRFQLKDYLAIGSVARAIKSAMAEESSLAVYFCPKHHREYNLLSWLVPLCAICLVITTAMFQTYVGHPAIFAVIFIVEVLGFITTLLWRSAIRGRLTVVAGDKRHAWLAGCCEEFVISLPPLDTAQAADAAAVGEKLRNVQ
jgi:hypothetical protein